MTRRYWICPNCHHINIQEEEPYQLCKKCCARNVGLPTAGEPYGYYETDVCG